MDLFFGMQFAAILVALIGQALGILRSQLRRP